MSIINRKTTIMAFLVLTLVFTSCTGGQKATSAPKTDTQNATAAVNAQYTVAAQTLIAGLTANAPAAQATQPAAALPQAASPTLPPTSTPPPSKTPIPSDTPLPTNTPLPSDTPTITATWTPTTPAEPQFKLAFKDDFNGGGFWPTDTFESANLHYTQGGYAIRTKVIGDNIFAVRRQLDLEFVDVRIEVRASRTEGPINGYYGIACRFADGSNYYFMIVGADGSYGIGKKNWNMWTWLNQGKNTDAIHTGNAPNQLRADCIGHTLTLWANGIKLAEAQDTDFSAGSIGLVVGTPTEIPFEALFDDFVAYVPQP